MKKIICSIFALTAFVMSAQSTQDAMRYAQDNLNGTARFRAMGGAFGALGGDFSSLNINPAGSSVFMNNQVGITLNNNNIRSNSSYFGSNQQDSDSNLNLNQAGFVLVYQNRVDSPWKKMAFAVNYDNVNNFDNTTFYKGTNPNNSVVNYFLANANGVPLELLETVPGESIGDLYGYLGTLPDFNYPNVSGFNAQQALLGYQAFVINPATNDPFNTIYNSNVQGNGNFTQQEQLVQSGYNGKLAFNFSAEYEDWLHLGINLNSHFSDYTRSSSFFEMNNNDVTQGIKSVRFNNDLRTFGNGFSFQLGAIAKIAPELRAGLSYESPTWMTFTDQFSQNIASSCIGCGANSSTNIVNPRIITEFPSYRLNIPGRWTGSLAYVFGKRGLLSVDFAVKDYRNTRFRPSDDFFRPVNNEMNDIFAMASELRVGGEYKIQRWSLRGGYRFEQSPYKNARTIGDLMGLSTGVGYNFGSTRLDLAYNYSQRDYEQSTFNVGMTDVAQFRAKLNSVTMTLLFEL
jgi:hypothetical protein